MYSGQDFFDRYEMRTDGLMVPFGNAADVERKEVKDKALRVLRPSDWRTTAEVWEAMPDRRPSREQLRLALVQLAEEGLAQRAPPLAVDARGKKHRWRLIPTSPGEMARACSE